MHTLSSLVLIHVGLGKLPLSRLHRLGTHLRVLVLADAELRVIPGDFFTHFHVLEKVLLSGNRLVRLPDTLFTRFSLGHLCLDRNRLEVVPPEVRGLTSLTHLDLSGNPVLEWPSPDCFAPLLNLYACS